MSGELALPHATGVVTPPAVLYHVVLNCAMLCFCEHAIVAAGSWAVCGQYIVMCLATLRHIPAYIV